MRQLGDSGLWLGNVRDVGDLDQLAAAEVLVVVDLACDQRPPKLGREIAYCRFPLIDGAGNPPWLLRLAVESVANLLRAGVPTLLYCGAGMSRTPAIAGAAVALVNTCEFDEGLRLAIGNGATDVSPALWAEVRAALA